MDQGRWPALDIDRDEAKPGTIMAAGSVAAPGDRDGGTLYVSVGGPEALKDAPTRRVNEVRIVRQGEDKMATTEERLKILKMVEEGKITAEDGARLLAALSSANGAPTAGATASTMNIRSGSGAKWLRIRVSDMNTGRSKVNINLPIALVSVGAKIAARFAPEAESLEVNQIVEAIKAGAQGKIIDVMDDDDGEHVEIYVE